MKREQYYMWERKMVGYLSPLRTKSSRQSGRLASFLILIIFTIAAGLIALNRQNIVDQLMVWQYHPTTEIQSIADRATMSDQGRFYFYSSQPQIDEAGVFNTKCRKQEEHSAILGCYTAHKIYIYNVSNAQLDGIKEVTAAHEMLHAVWDRQTKSEKQRLEPLLMKIYNRIATDALRERMAYYDRTQPGERLNELHSIIGTEVVDVGTELEQYYSKYFTNRQGVASLHDRYEAVFFQLKSTGDTLSAQLTALGAEIEQTSVNYNQGVSQLNAEITNFNQQAESGGFSSQAAFDAGRNALVTRSGQLEAQRATINTKIANYNNLRDQLTSINSQSEALNRSVDSSLAPAPAI